MTDHEAATERVRLHLSSGIELRRQTLEHCGDSIAQAGNVLLGALRQGRKVLLCGNGGSAADCQHMAAELVGGLRPDTARPGLAAVALTTDTSFITAYSNDHGFASIFERQVTALGREGDVLIAISTSGESDNVLRAVDAAHAVGMATVGLTGRGGKLKDRVTVAIAVPSEDTQLVQEMHLAVEHALCDVVENAISGNA